MSVHGRGSFLMLLHEEHLLLHSHILSFCLFRVVPFLFLLLTVHSIVLLLLLELLTAIVLSFEAHTLSVFLHLLPSRHVLDLFSRLMLGSRHWERLLV